MVVPPMKFNTQNILNKICSHMALVFLLRSIFVLQFCFFRVMSSVDKMAFTTFTRFYNCYVQISLVQQYVSTWWLKYQNEVKLWTESRAAANNEIVLVTWILLWKMWVQNSFLTWKPIWTKFCYINFCSIIMIGKIQSFEWAQYWWKLLYQDNILQQYQIIVGFLYLWHVWPIFFS